MFFLVAWSLIGGATFLAVFYLNIYLESDESDLPQLESSPSVTVIIPAYNEDHVIKKAIKGTLEIDYEQLKVLVVDDGSEDTTLEKAKSFDDERLSVIEREENGGKARALNEVLERVDSEYTVVQDADTVINTELIERALKKFQENDEMGAVIGSIQNFKSNTFIRRLQRVQYQMTNFYRKMMSNIDTLDVTPGAFSMYRTSDLREVGGFDIGNPTEDLDMAWRLRRIGRSIDMVFSSESRTEFPEDLKSLYRQRVRWKRGSIVNLIKHRDMILSSEYGWFGKWQLPVHAISPLLAAGALLVVIIGLIDSLFNFAVSYSAVGLQLRFGAFDEVMSTLLAFQYKIYVPLALGMMVSLVMIVTAYREAEKEFMNPVALVTYFLAFYIFQGFFVLSALIKEILNTKTVWN